MPASTGPALHERSLTSVSVEKECRIGLQRHGQCHWQFVNAYNGQPITHIEVQTWALGISTIGNLCPVHAA